MKQSILLFNTPYTDYTQPYHSLSYLSGTLKEAGFNVDVIDLNIEWFRWVFNSKNLNKWEAELTAELADLESRAPWTIEHQIKATKIVQCLAIVQSIDPVEAIDIFQSEKFYDYQQYLKAQHCVRKFERVLEHFYGFYPFYLAFRAPCGEPKMADLIEGIQSSQRFISDIEDLLRSQYSANDYLFCGASIPFYGNARLGFAALRAAANLFPESKLIAGGTAATDIFKNKKDDKTLIPLGEYCDYLLAGEADETIIQLARWLGDSQSTPPNGLFDLKQGKLLTEKYIIAPQPIQGQNIVPDYSWIKWDKYLSPEKQINYSPSRGCFWNRCTFCDYGLNDDLPTAPYRAESPQITADHFAHFSSLGINNIYLAVDAITPSFLKKLANQLVERKIKVNWSAEFFLTEHFDQDLIQLLEKSGLVTASFGFESGSSKVLQLMGKGADRVEKVYHPVFKAFANSKIGLQPKFFFGCPGENNDDRWKTVNLLNEYREIFPVLTRANTFDLTEGSIVAKNPEEYGITNVVRKENYDINSACDYQHLDDSPVTNIQDYDELNAALDYFEIFERPWCGGIDTFHSKLYIKKYGRNIFSRIQKQLHNRLDQVIPQLSISVKSQFNLSDVFDNVLIYSALQYTCSLDKLSREMSEQEIQSGLEAVTTPMNHENISARYSLQFR